MELPCRGCGDELLKPGELPDIVRRLRGIAAGHDLATVIACAFDHRTIMLPFIYADKHMVPAGIRAVGSAMVEAGFVKTRIVLQQWNRRFKPSHMKLDGRVPDIFMVSSMQIHSESCKALIRDACRIDRAARPLIIAGGPKMIYQPWDAFSVDPADPWAADVAVTGEEYVLLNLLEVLLSLRSGREPIRATFLRARDSGELDGIAGLVYAKGSRDGVAEELVDTGIQRLVGDLDELPNPAAGYGILEPPSRRSELSSSPVPAGRVRKLNTIGSMVMTLGCKFSCPYCPIPAYNQRKLRYKSGEKIVEEMVQFYRAYGMRYFFGTDDNFFNNKQRTCDIIEKMASTEIDGKPFRKVFRWGTEVTVHDTLQMKDHLRDVRKAGVRALWLGVEDMTATLIKKGQSVSKTIEVFSVLRDRGIAPMPMMMHYDDQPLYTRGRPLGLLNQVSMLRKAGALSLQVLMITPATGSKMYEETFTSGMVYESVGGRPVEPHMFDGNYVIASNHPKPWRKQFNILIAYAFFYNPLRFLAAMFWPKAKLYLGDAGMQLLGMWGLAKTVRRTFGWALRLAFGRVKRCSRVPANCVPMHGPDGSQAAHALPETPTGS